MLFYLCLFFCIGIVNLTELSYYEVLGVEKRSTAQEIRQAYKRLAVKFHPDKNPELTLQEKFIKITEAYEVLKDPEKRQRYDLYGSFSTYGARPGSQSQAEYNKMFYNGLYADDLFVDTITPNIFQTYMADGLYFINFYSPFCPPCQSLSDTWKRLAEKYQGIVKVGAVNCKYHNAFCHNVMRIHSYPTLFFYPYGNKGNNLYYRNDRSFEALDSFVMAQLRDQIPVPIVTKLVKDKKRCTVHIIGTSWFDLDSATRIAYHLRNLASVAIIDDDDLRSRLSDDDSTTAVIKCGDVLHQTKVTDEAELLNIVSDTLPGVETVSAERLREIRTSLRSQSTRSGWVLYFTDGTSDKLFLHKLQNTFPQLKFGEINCGKDPQLCYSLQIESQPNWAVLKPGGGYQRALPPTMPGSLSQVIQFIQTAIRAETLQTLSFADYKRIVDSDRSTWVLCLIPHLASWDHLQDMFFETAINMVDKNLQFGILACTESNAEACTKVAHHPVVVVRVQSKQYVYRGHAHAQDLVHYIHTLQSPLEDLSDDRILDILDHKHRHKAWLVAFMPSNCGQRCEHLTMQWHAVSNKLSPLSTVSVGAVWCEDFKGFCANVKSPTIKLYLAYSKQHYVASMHQLGEAIYMLEWALPYLKQSLVSLTQSSFHSHVFQHGSKPWLVYYHSPRCHHCYEMFADFMIAGILMNDAIELGKVNCISERPLCQREQITRYPTLKLYLNKNQHISYDTIITVPVREYTYILQDIYKHLNKYDASLLVDLKDVQFISGFKHMKHDEL